MKVALTVNDFLRRAEQIYPHREAIVDEPVQPAESWGAITYAEMAARARAQAAALCTRRCQPARPGSSEAKVSSISRKIVSSGKTNGVGQVRRIQASGRPGVSKWI